MAEVVADDVHGGSAHKMQCLNRHSTPGSELWSLLPQWMCLSDCHVWCSYCCLRLAAHEGMHSCDQCVKLGMMPTAALCLLSFGLLWGQGRSSCKSTAAAACAVHSPKACRCQGIGLGLCMFFGMFQHHSLVGGTPLTSVGKQRRARLCFCIPLHARPVAPCR